MMDSDKKQLLLNINGESEVVVTRRRVRQPIWALAIVVFLLIAIAIGGVLVLCKVFLDWSDTTELSFSTATISGKRQNVTVNVDKKWVQYHVLGDAISKQPEVLTVHDFHWNLHVIKVIDVEDSNQSKCFVGSLDRRTFPSPTDIMQFATDDSIDIQPMELKLHYEGYDWLNIELSLLGPIYHKLCQGVETAYIFPAYDDADLLLDAPSGQLSLLASSPLDEKKSSPVLYTFSYVIDHHQEDARKKVRLERAVTLSPYQLVASRHSFNRYNAPSLNQNRNGYRVRRQVDVTPPPYHGGSGLSMSPHSLNRYRNQPRQTREQSHHQEGARFKIRLERNVTPAPSQKTAARSAHSLNRYRNQPRRTRDADDEQSRHRSRRSAQPNDYDESTTDDDTDDEIPTAQPPWAKPNSRPGSTDGTSERSGALSLSRYRPRGRREVDDEESHHRSRRSAQPDDQGYPDYEDDNDEDDDDDGPPSPPPWATSNNQPSNPGSTDGTSVRSKHSINIYRQNQNRNRPRGPREVDGEQSHHRSRRSAQPDDEDHTDDYDESTTDDDTDDEVPPPQPPWAKPNNRPGSTDGTSERSGALSLGRYRPSWNRYRNQPRRTRDVDDEENHHRSRRSAQPDDQGYPDYEDDNDEDDDDDGPPSPPPWATSNNQPLNPGNTDGTSVRGRLSPPTRYSPRGRGSG